MKINLKTQNLPFIGIYAIFNIAILLTILKNATFSIDVFQVYFSDLQAKDGIYVSLLSLLIILVGGMFSNKFKEIIVFWRLNHRLPGCFAFSKFMHEDKRIDIKVLKQKYGKLPKNNDKENKLWYQIYKSMNDKTIDKTHKDSLLCRELSVMSILMFIFPIVIYFIHNAVALSVYYFIFLVLEYLIVRYCAKHSAERLVVNVLALASIK